MKKQLEQWRGVLQEDHDNGFSLLEVVVAVSIMLILAVVGTLGYQGYQDNARDAAVETAAQQVYTAGQAEQHMPGTSDLDKVASDYTASADGITTTISEGEKDICVHAVMPDRPQHVAERGDCEGIALPETDGTPGDGDDNGDNTEDTGIAIAAPQNVRCDSPALIGRPNIRWNTPEDYEVVGYVFTTTHVSSTANHEYKVDNGNITNLSLTDDNISLLLGDNKGLGGKFNLTIKAIDSDGNISEVSNGTTFYPGLTGMLLPSCA